MAPMVPQGGASSDSQRAAAIMCFSSAASPGGVGSRHGLVIRSAPQSCSRNRTRQERPSSPGLPTSKFNTTIIVLA